MIVLPGNDIVDLRPVDDERQRQCGPIRDVKGHVCRSDSATIATCENERDREHYWRDR